MDTNIAFSKYAHNQIIYKEGDLIGKCIFLKEVQRTHPTTRRALFQCVCGKSFESNIVLAKTGDRVGCGCSQSRIILKGIDNPSYKHGATQRNMPITPEYNSWISAKGRCFDVKNVDYPEYGGRGITMAPEWVNDFNAFSAHVGLRPTSRHSLDRHPDKNGNYEPGNVRWATPKEQARNTRKNRNLTFKGQTKTLAEWAEEIGIKGNTISRRLKRGWSLENAMMPQTFKGNASLNLRENIMNHIM